MTLTTMQKQYIWLAGSHSDMVVQQGQGKRSKTLLYGIDEAEGTLIIFGYSNPLYFMKDRFFRQLQDFRSYVLTDAGQAEFNKLLLVGFGDKPGIEKVKVSPRPQK